MKITLKIRTVATRVSILAMLFTIAMLTSTFALAKPAHATSLLDQLRNIFNSEKQQQQNHSTQSNNNDKRTDDSSNTLQYVIARGDAEITRRLQKLSQLNGQIDALAHLSATDKAALKAQVNNAIVNLNALKAKLDAETTVAAAKADARTIVTEYRVYALVLPKIHLIKLADDIQTTDDKLTELADKLQTRISTAKDSGKDVSTLETKLTDMKAQIAAGQNIAGNVETKVASLQPSDYNNDHKILSGYSAQLQTARSNNKAAYADAQFIINALKTL